MMLVKFGIVLLILAVAAILGAYWWANIPPSRPRELSANAVWLWAPSVGLPAPKRGIWLACWNGSHDGKCRCKTIDKDGRTLYEGMFLPYRQERPVSGSDLTINIEQTQQHHIDQGIFLQGELVPLVYLKNGDVLIPAAKYEDGRRSLDALQHFH
jgi:hypothetical protein